MKNSEQTTDGWDLFKEKRDSEETTGYNVQK